MTSEQSESNNNPTDEMMASKDDDGNASKAIEETKEEEQTSKDGEETSKRGKDAAKTTGKPRKKWTFSSLFFSKGGGEEVRKKEDDAAEIKTEPKKKWSFWSLFSLPVLKILQGFWLITMIRNSLSGNTTSFFPFGGGSSTHAQNSEKVHPFYAEMRSDLYGDQQQFRSPGEEESFGLMGLFFGPKPVKPTLPLNSGIPKHQRIVMSHLNREYESFRWSVQSATTSKVQASHEFAQNSLRRALVKTLSRITDEQDVHSLTILEENFMEVANSLLDKKGALRKMLVGGDDELFGSLQQCNVTNSWIPTSENVSTLDEAQCFDETAENSTDDELADMANPKEGLNVTSGRNTTLSKIKKIDRELKNATTTFLGRIKECLPEGPAHAINDVLVGHQKLRGIPSLVEGLNNFPMRILLSDVRRGERQRLFVLHFVGDLFASQVETLRKEVTAILRSAKSPDEVLVILRSSGGTVTGYGLVAAQLLRIKEAGLRLTVAVEQVAASGGYLAAAVAPTIICSPFAVVGSIGVIQEVPNIYKRLKDEGVEFHSITAGKYKRVLSATKEVTSDDLEKARADVEEIHVLFQEFVKEHRPRIDLDVVATGDVWFGTRAVEVGLCDAIQTADSVLMDYVDNGFDVYHVKYEEPLEGYLNNLLGGLSESVAVNRDVFAKNAIQWISQKLLALLNADLGDRPVFMA